MAQERYAANRAALFQRMRVPNPIPEETLITRAAYFHHPDGVLEVAGTPQNLAGRAFLEDYAAGRRSFNADSRFRWHAARFFTPELWLDCGPERRTLVHGCRIAYRIHLVLKK